MLIISGRLLALTKCEIEYRDKQISQAERTSQPQSSSWHGGIGKSETLYSRVFDIAACRRKANVWANNSQKFP